MLLFGNDYGVNMDTIEMAYNLVLAVIQSNITQFNYQDYEQILILFGHILRTNYLSPEYHLKSLGYLIIILDHICNNHINNKYTFIQESQMDCFTLSVHGYGCQKNILILLFRSELRYKSR